ncbi:MAG: hypothetical protein IJ875_06555 [Solobacterium sp.]|nr:hypothetical protein [Solobacterium sp.]
MKNREAFEGLIQKAKARNKRLKVAIAGGDVENIMKGVFMAEEEGFVEPIFIGNGEKINSLIEKLGYSDRKYEIHNLSDDVNVVQYAIEMVNAGKAEILMRGNTQTRDFLMPILNKGNHLLKENHLLTHVTVLSIPDYPRLLAVSDVTIMVEPSIEERKHVVKNMVRVLEAFGIEYPSIALLALVEKPSFHMRDTVEAQNLVMDHEEEEIAPCHLIGPISYDLIMSKEAARLKNYDCAYCGEFDGIVVPNLMSGNLIVKILEHNAGAIGSGVIVGAKVPIAITSRSDSEEQSFLSLATCVALLEKYYENA